MTPTTFREANTTFGPPPGLDESQVQSIPAYSNQLLGGNLDGTRVVVVAWQPDAEDLRRLNEGAPIYLLMCGALLPHCIASEFPLQNFP
jgi:hypothetical protein